MKTIEAREDARQAYAAILILKRDKAGEDVDLDELCASERIIKNYIGKYGLINYRLLYNEGENCRLLAIPQTYTLPDIKPEWLPIKKVKRVKKQGTGVYAVLERPNLFDRPDLVWNPPGRLRR